jgi:hypothetical protein
MSKAEKLATKILSGKSDKNFDFDDLCYVLVSLVLRRGLVGEVIESITKMELWRLSTSSRAMEKRNHIR